MLLLTPPFPSRAWTRGCQVEFGLAEIDDAGPPPAEW